MQTTVRTVLLFLALLSASVPPLLHAGTVQGNAITIQGLDDLSATADSQARKGVGKIFAMLLGMGGLASILSGRIGLGLGGVGAGLGMGFVPGMVSSAFDAASPAVALGTAPGVEVWWHPLTAGLYLPLLLLRLVQDPVVLLACGGALCLIRLTRSPRMTP